MQAVREIVGRGVPLDRADVDTDQIIPSDWLKRVERTGFGAGLFSEWRESSDFVLNQDVYDGAEILVAGPNFGTGSSREHAPWALEDYGFRAVISSRFADIFRNNCAKNGLVPVIVSESTVEQIWTAIEADPAVEITVDVQRLSVEVPAAVDADGIHPRSVGSMPPQLIALNRTFLNVVELTVRAVLEGDRRHVYQAALLDPNTAATLSTAQTVEMCDELFAAHDSLIPAALRPRGG